MIETFEDKALRKNEQKEQDFDGATGHKMLGLFSQTSLPFSCEVPFDDIPIWMPPSPPNSETDATLVPSFDIYPHIDGALLYQPGLMCEDELPPLPPLLPSLDTFPRGLSRSPRKTVESPLRVMPTKPRRRRSTSTTAKIALAGEGKRQQIMQKNATAAFSGIPSEFGRIGSEEIVGGRRLVAGPSAFERPPSPPESAPNTPMVMAPMNIMVSVPPMPQLLPVPGHIIVVASPTTLLPPKLEQHADASVELAAAVPGPSSSVPVHAVATPISTLDEAIESTLRKSRKRVQSPSTFMPLVPRYLVRNFGPLPQQPFERVGPDSSRHIFRLVCPEWRANLNAFLTPGGTIGTEPVDFEGVPWTAAEDQRLLRAISERHCLLNPAVDQLPLNVRGIHFNWEFVSQYVNIRSSQYRSPRQCALRYQNFILHCDEAFDDGASVGRKGPTSGAPFSRRARNSFVSPPSPPHSVIFDTNLGVQEASSVARRRAAQLANCALLRRRMAPLMAERTTTESQGQSQNQSQLFCLTGRMPPQQEAQLNELGTRYTNVARATDIIDVRRQMLERRATAQQRRVTPAPPTTH